MIVGLVRSAAQAVALLGCLLFGVHSLAEPERPNILWFVVDDMSANFSCYGEKAIQTPHVDRLAGEGVRFTRAYATSPVCSTFRSALITGMYQTSIGAHHQRRSLTVGSPLCSSTGRRRPPSALARSPSSFSSKLEINARSKAVFPTPASPTISTPVL